MNLSAVLRLATRGFFPPSISLPSWRSLARRSGCLVDDHWSSLGGSVSHTVEVIKDNHHHDEVDDDVYDISSSFKGAIQRTLSPKTHDLQEDRKDAGSHDEEHRREHSLARTSQRKYQPYNCYWRQKAYIREIPADDFRTQVPQLQGFPDRVSTYPSHKKTGHNRT